jgi:hypothetical protein
MEKVNMIRHGVSPSPLGGERAGVRGERVRFEMLVDLR